MSKRWSYCCEWYRIYRIFISLAGNLQVDERVAGGVGQVLLIAAAHRAQRLHQVPRCGRIDCPRADGILSDENALAAADVLVLVRQAAQRLPHLRPGIIV